MANYLEDSDLYYEIILSKGLGKLTRKAEYYFELIATNTIRRLLYKYKYGEMDDCLQHGMLKLFSNWFSFNEKRFKYALPYFTEMFKRGTTEGYNEFHNRKPHQKDKYIKYVSIDSINDGSSMQNIY